VTEVPLSCDLTISHDREEELLEFVRSDEFRESRIRDSNFDEEDCRVEHQQEVDLFVTMVESVAEWKRATKWSSHQGSDEEH
jgi:hypothetical protein